MGQRLFSGNVNVLNTPFPVEMFEPRSYLEKLADVWVHPRFLREAAATANPQERMRLTITWFIAGGAWWGIASMKGQDTVNHAAVHRHAVHAPHDHAMTTHASFQVG